MDRWIREDDKLLYTVWSLVMVRVNQLLAQEIKIGTKQTVPSLVFFLAEKEILCNEVSSPHAVTNLDIIYSEGSLKYLKIRKTF